MSSELPASLSGFRFKGGGEVGADLAMLFRTRVAATGIQKKLAPPGEKGLLRGLDRNDQQPSSSPRSLAFPHGEGLDVPSLGDETDFETPAGMSRRGFLFPGIKPPRSRLTYPFLLRSSLLTPLPF